MGGIPTSTLRNHPGFWMRSDAESSLARWESAHGVIEVNSAGRTEAAQQGLIDRWNQGGTYNRPPYLYEPKRPASASSHVYDGGIAFDTSEWQRFIKTCADYGWYQRYSWDFVHFEYNPATDKFRYQPAGGNAVPVEPDPITIQEDDMGYFRIGDSGPCYVYGINDAQGISQEEATALARAASGTGTALYKDGTLVFRRISAKNALLIIDGVKFRRTRHYEAIAKAVGASVAPDFASINAELDQISADIAALGDIEPTDATLETA